MPARPRIRRAERREAFDVLVSTYEAALLRYAARLTGNPSNAEDLVQNTFLKLIHRWRDPWEPSPLLSAWLYRVVHNEAIDQIRREARRHALHVDHARTHTDDGHASNSALDTPSERAAAAADALARLPERDRQLVVLKVYEGKSYREISEITGLSSGNIGFILHHAMRKLAETLRQEESDVHAAP